VVVVVVLTAVVVLALVVAVVVLPGAVVGVAAPPVVGNTAPLDAPGAVLVVEATVPVVAPSVLSVPVPVVPMAVVPVLPAEVALVGAPAPVVATERPWGAGVLVAVPPTGEVVVGTLAPALGSTVVTGSLVETLGGELGADVNAVVSAMDCAVLSVVGVEADVAELEKGEVVGVDESEAGAVVGAVPPAPLVAPLVLPGLLGPRLSVVEEAGPVGLPSLPAGEPFALVGVEVVDGAPEAPAPEPGFDPGLDVGGASGWI